MIFIDAERGVKVDRMIEARAKERPFVLSWEEPLWTKEPDGFGRKIVREEGEPREVFDWIVTELLLEAHQRGVGFGIDLGRIETIDDGAPSIAAELLDRREGRRRV